MGTAARLRSYRVRAGKSRKEVAEHLGLNDAWYDDLEQNDDELASTLTLFQAVQLASFLGVPLWELLDAGGPPQEIIALTELPSRIRAHAARAGLSTEQLEEEMGWDVRDFLDSPLKVASESPIVFLQVLAHWLDIDWLSLVPEERAD